MSIPPEIAVIVERLNDELAQEDTGWRQVAKRSHCGLGVSPSRASGVEMSVTEQEALQGINLVRPLLAFFPDNLRLIQFFALFNNVILFIELSKRRIQATIERFSSFDTTIEEIQESGENLGTLLGRVIKTKIEVRQVIKILEELQ